VKNQQELILNGTTPILQQKRQDILEMLTAALDAVQPAQVMSRVIQDSQLLFPQKPLT